MTFGGEHLPLPPAVYKPDFFTLPPAEPQLYLWAARSMDLTQRTFVLPFTNTTAPPTTRTFFPDLGYACEWLRWFVCWPRP